MSMYWIASPIGLLRRVLLDQKVGLDNVLLGIIIRKENSWGDALTRLLLGTVVDNMEKELLCRTDTHQETDLVVHIILFAVKRYIILVNEESIRISSMPLILLLRCVHRARC